MERIETMTLRGLVEPRVARRWKEWAKRHPHLAAAIDRTRLVESTVDRLTTDAAFAEAMREADLDEADLARAARVLDQADRVVTRLMPM